MEAGCGSGRRRSKSGERGFSFRRSRAAMKRGLESRDSGRSGTAVGRGEEAAEGGRWLGEGQLVGMALAGAESVAEDEATTADGPP